MKPCQSELTQKWLVRVSVQLVSPIGTDATDALTHRDSVTVCACQFSD